MMERDFFTCQMSLKAFSTCMKKLSTDHSRMATPTPIKSPSCVVAR